MCESPASPLDLPIRGIRYLGRMCFANVLDVFYLMLVGINVTFLGVILMEKEVNRFRKWPFTEVISLENW